MLEQVEGVTDPVSEALMQAITETLERQLTEAYLEATAQSGESADGEDQIEVRIVEDVERPGTPEEAWSTRVAGAANPWGGGTEHRSRRGGRRASSSGGANFPTRAPVGSEIPFPPLQGAGQGRWSVRAWRAERRLQIADPNRWRHTAWWGGAHSTNTWRGNGTPGSCPGGCGRQGTTVDAWEWLAGYCCGTCRDRHEGRSIGNPHCNRCIGDLPPPSGLTAR